MSYINISKDEFNSCHFGLVMANMQITDELDTFGINQVYAEMENALKVAKDDGIEHVSCSITTNRSDVINALELCDFNLIDTLVTYEFVRGRAILQSVDHSVEIGDCLDTDVDELCRLAQKAYQIDRYHKDKSLDAQLCDSYYEKWTRNCIKNNLADRVIVAHINARPVGYMPVKIYPEKMELRMILSAVSEEYRGSGIFTSMSHECARFMLEDCKRTADKLLAGTYIDNIAVQKAWIRLGYTLYGSKYIFQKKL